MIDHVWTVLCSRAVIDVDSQNVSIHNVIEQLNVAAEPAPDLVIGIAYELVSLWVRSEIDTPTKGRTRVTLISPTGATTAVAEMPIDLSQVERARHRISCQGLHVTGPGRYVFRVELSEEDGEWRRVASVPLRVVFTP
jgi:hypothetical protein